MEPISTNNIYKENEEVKNYHKKICEKLMADYLKMAETGRGVFNFNNTKFVDDLYEKVKQEKLETKDFLKNLIYFYNHIEKRPDKADSICQNKEYWENPDLNGVMEDELNYAMDLISKMSNDHTKITYRMIEEFETKILKKGKSREL